MIGGLSKLIPAPYRWLAIVLVITVAAGSIYAKGRMDGHASGTRDAAADVRKAERRAGDAASALRAAAARLNADSALFREISTLTSANAELAKAASTKAETQGTKAERDSERLRRSISELEYALAKERDTCTDGSKPICGTPLQ